MGSCLGGLLGAEQVLAWQWAGVCSNGCLLTPCLQKSITCTGSVPTQPSPSKSKGTHPVSPRPPTHLLEATRTEGSCLAEEEPRGVPPRALCSACIPRDSSRLLQELPPGGKAMEGHSIRPSAPGSRRNFSLREMSKRHPSPSPTTFWTHVFNE